MEIYDLPKDKIIILFDGVCNLCDSSVQYIIRKDTQDSFRFAALQSEIGIKIITHIGIANENIDSIIAYIPDVSYYYKSDAALVIAKKLGGFLSFTTIFKLVPTSIRNFVYDFVAKNRYKWYGKKDNCMIPTPELKAKFLE